MSTSASSVSGAPGATQRRGGDRSSCGTKIGGTRLHVTRRGDREYRAGREYVRLNTNSTRIVSKAPAATRGRDSDSTATRRPSRGGIRRPFRPPLSPPPPRFSPLPLRVLSDARFHSPFDTARTVVHARCPTSTTLPPPFLLTPRIRSCLPERAPPLRSRRRRVPSPWPL